MKPKVHASKTLIYGAGPIGRWLAYRFELTGQDVTLLARDQTYHTLKERGLEIVDGLTGERLTAPVSPSTISRPRSFRV